MAKTAYTIYLDYQKALRQADRLEEAAKKIKNARGTLYKNQCFPGITPVSAQNCAGMLSIYL